MNPRNTGTANILLGLVFVKVMLNPEEALGKIKEEQLGLAEQGHQNSIEQAKYDFHKQIKQQPKLTRTTEQSHHHAPHR